MSTAPSFQPFLAEALEPRRLLSFELVTDLAPNRDSEPHGLVAFNNKVLFAATTFDSESHTRIWASDGTAVGTRDLAGYDSGTFWRYGGAVVAGSKLYFRGNVASRSVIWGSDGTVAGTTRLARDVGGFNYTGTWAADLGGRLIFLGNTTGIRLELFSTDGTDAGTVELTGNLGGAHANTETVVGAHNGLVWFADSTSQGIYRLGVTDGTAAGTRLIADLNTGAGTPIPLNFTPVGNQVFFQVATGQGMKLWKSDGTTAGTGPVDTDLVVVAGSMAELGGHLYFLGTPVRRGTAQLYRTDGTRSGTQLVANVDFNSFYDEESNLFRAGDYIWFDNSNSQHRSDGRGGLWRTDGTTAGTRQIFQQPAGQFFLDGRRLWLGNLYYAIDLDQPDEPRRTGLAAARMNQGNYLEHWFSLARLGEHVYFPHDGELYRSTVPEGYMANVHVHVFHDADGDGTRDAGEGPFPSQGVWPYVDLNNDGTRQNEEPAAGVRPDGTALLVGVPDGPVSIRLGGSGLRVTTPDPATVTVTAGQDPPPVVIGANRNNRVSGSVYDDRDGDGTRDTGEPGIEGRRVFLDADADGAYDAGEPFTLTDAAGVYRFEQLPSGTLRAELPAGWRGTQNAGGHNHTNYTVARDVAYGPFGQTTLPLPGRVIVLVFYDHNGDGVQDSATAEPIAQAPMSFHLDTDGDGVVDDGEKTGASQNGTIILYQVPPASHTVRVTQPTGWQLSTPPPVVNVPPGSEIRVQVGIRPSAAAPAVSGTVFADPDLDGTRDAGEPGVANMLVFLDLDNNNAMGGSEPSTPTDFSGRYRFPGLAAGTYRVVAVTGSRGYTAVAPRAPQARTVTFDGANPAPDADFAVAPAARNAFVTGRVYRDVNGNGSFDSGDTPLPNVIVYNASQVNAYAVPGVRRVVSGADGTYALPVSGGGTHRVTVLVPAGWTAESATSAQVTAAALQAVPGPDFRLDPGAAALPASIRGNLFEDLDADGARGPVEPAPRFHFNGPGPMMPYLDLDRDGLRDPAEPIAPHDEFGNYLFGNLAPGTYHLRLGATEGYGQTAPAALAPHTLTIAAGEAAGPLTLGGTYLPARVSGEIYLDIDGNGRRDPSDPPTSQTVAIDTNGNGTYGDTGDRRATSDSTGRFTFTNVSPGDYRAVVLPTAAHRQSYPANGEPLVLSLRAGQDLTGLEFGVSPVAPTTGSIGGMLFHDANRDGQRGTNESMSAGWTIWVRSVSNPAQTWTLTTNSQGRWQLNNLPPGAYRVGADLAANTFEFTAPAAPPHEYAVDLVAGQDRLNLDFGVDTKPVNFEGEVFEDLNANGTWDAGESALPGITVEGPGQPVTTDASGRFVFQNVPTNRNEYTFHAVRPPRTLYSTPWERDFITAGHPTPGTTLNVGRFGIYAPTSHYISGTSFTDLNANGRRDPGEPGVAGRVIAMDTNHDGVIDLSDQFAKTDRHGWYAFTRFDSRPYYRLREMLANDLVGTLPPNGGWQIVNAVPGETYTDVDFGSIPWSAKGELFNDRDNDGVRDAGEGGVAGRTVYVDANGNGAPDPGEPSAVTDAAGAYGLLVASAGVYRIRQVVPGGWAQSFPAGGAAHEASLAPGATAAGKDFGVADVPPRVLRAAAAFELVPTRLKFTFSEDVAAALQAEDLSVVNLAGGPSPAGSFELEAYDPVAQAATFRFRGASGTLPNGNYRATVAAAGVADAGGNRLAADYQFDFFILTGDINRDRAVNGSDFAILAGSFGKTGMTYAQGDVNGDGSVNGSDFALLAGNFGKTVPAPPQAALVAPAAARPALAAPATRRPVPSGRRAAAAPAKRTAAPWRIVAPAASPFTRRLPA